jgi:hypothetical protein
VWKDVDAETCIFGESGNHAQNSEEEEKEEGNYGKMFTNSWRKLESVGCPTLGEGWGQV